MAITSGNNLCFTRFLCLFLFGAVRCWFIHLEVVESITCNRCMGITRAQRMTLV